LLHSGAGISVSDSIKSVGSHKGIREISHLRDIRNIAITVRVTIIILIYRNTVERPTANCRRVVDFTVIEIESIMLALVELKRLDF
jgi:hypothetical protein